MGSPFDLSIEEQLIYDKTYAWFESRHGFMSGSKASGLMAGIDDPILLDSDELEIVINAIKQLPPESFSKNDGKPAVKPLNELLSSFKVTAPERDYAFKQIDPYTEGLKTIAKIAYVQTLTNFEMPQELNIPQMIRGKLKEPQAIATAEFKLGLDFENTGHDQEFLLFNDIFGSTPDGLRRKGQKIITGIEAKCPDSKTHFDYMKEVKDAKTLKEHNSGNYWQCQSHMLCAKAAYWWFASFDDRYKNEDQKLHLVKIERCDEDIENLKKRIDLAREYQQTLKLNAVQPNHSHKTTSGTRKQILN